MRVLLSAYACEPGLGSEAAVGWGWATHLAHDHEIHVLTRKSNQARIEQATGTTPIPNLTFHYFDLPAWARFWKKGNTGVYLYYLLWQYGAYCVARRLCQRHAFDIVHHVTFVSIRFPSFMGELGIPFVFGPVAGGEHAPPSLWKSLGGRAMLKESLRILSMKWLRFSPLVQRTFSKTSHIVTTSAQSTFLIPKRLRNLSSEMLGIALTENECKSLSVCNDDPQVGTKTFRVFYAGRCLYWKGMDLGLHAFARLQEAVPYAKLDIIGSGPELRHWMQLSASLGITESVNWFPEIQRVDFMAALKNFDALLFPSLHDSGGMVVLEAMAAGIPPVCLDIGGPSTLVTPDTGEIIQPSGREEVINELHLALLNLANDVKRRKQKGRNAARRVKEHFTWQGKVSQMNKIYSRLVQA